MTSEWRLEDFWGKNVLGRRGSQHRGPEKPGVWEEQRGGHRCDERKEEVEGDDVGINRDVNYDRTLSASLGTWAHL